LYQKNFFSLPGKIPPVPLQPLDDDVAKALQKLHLKQQFVERLPKIDCGACGSPTCSTFAEDVVKQTAAENDCVFLAIEKFATISNDLLETVLPHSRRVPQTRDVSKL
jgi:Na+-translocating ferredoxin:NAD+ oxidoreductase RNF subunit RnfB